MIVRGEYNAPTPFYRWHTVAGTNEAGYVTACGLLFMSARPTTQTANSHTTGDTCQTLACRTGFSQKETGS